MILLINHISSSFRRLIYRRSYHSLVLFILVSFTSGTAYASTSLPLIGSGDMRLYFMNIYTVSYYAKNTEDVYTYPAALEIEYKKKMSAATLVKATRKEWLRMNLNHDQKEVWLTQLDTIWPDVKPGDTLRLNVDEQGASTFLYNGELIGHLTGTSFSNHFLSIWLSDKARNQKLRYSLIGRR